MTLANGTRLGPYEITDRIGAGGMGEVYRARDTRLDRTVAIKILPSQFASNASLEQRFEREAKMISQLNHPHICTLFDVGSESIVEAPRRGVREDGADDGRPSGPPLHDT
ncbi:MAG TPA: protein kinase, partial [Thermoanaerobaculia bacterium]